MIDIWSFGLGLATATVMVVTYKIALLVLESPRT